MNRIPIIKVQIVHIVGPLQGQIQEFTDTEISIGRNPSCSICFPKDLAIISRRHARIVREGNRFKLIDESSNGTFVNGKPVGEMFLKDGDVIMLAEGGPKISFLSTLVETPLEVETSLPPVTVSPPPEPPRPSTPSPLLRPSLPTPPPPPREEPAEVPVEKTHVPLIIQFGPTLRSFKELPVTIGRGAACHFMIHHPRILDQHAQFFFIHERYWVRDLTGKQLVRVNDRPIDLKAPLSENDRVALSPEGPTFRFLGAGRLAEIEEPVLSKTDPFPEPPAGGGPRPPGSSASGRKGLGGFLKKWR
ncbi:MAG: FHA domain-containing protein [Desulfobacteraceae bacterium]|nr:MAG: FHA domain-containing protein [Desulfobacteraceae bacterium]